MEKKIKQAGTGGKVEFWAGSDVVSMLLGIVKIIPPQCKTSSPIP
jgi:hypothetical protein